MANIRSVKPLKATFKVYNVEYGDCEVRPSAGTDFDAFPWVVTLPDGREFSARNEELEFEDD